MQDLRTMTIGRIAILIADDWNAIPECAAVYVNAMVQLNSITDQYIMDPGSEVVARFLCNASTWKGEIARAVKKELNRRLKGVYKHA